MRKNGLLLTFILFAFTAFTVPAFAQPCTIDPLVGNEPGLYPDTLPDGDVGSFYDETIQIILPKDTVLSIPPFGMLMADFCSFVLDSISNLPDGITYECDPPGCVFEVDHTIAVNRYCARLSGTPTEAVLPNDSLSIYVKANIGNYDAVADTCIPLAIMLPPSLTTILFQMPWRINGGAMAIEDLNKEDLNVSLFPNPSNGLSVLRFEMPEKANVNVAVYDITGRKVRSLFNGPMYNGSQSFDIGTGNLSNGMYFVRISLDNGKKSFTEKLVVNN